MFNGQDLLAITEGEMRRLRGGVMAMIFQDPMTFLNPLMTVGDQIGEAIRLHQDLPNADVRSQILAILRRVHIPSPETVIDYYPHQLSGGMRQRVLIGMAISCRPSLMIADEPTTALDVTIQAQVMNLLSEVRRELGSAMLLITHDLGLVAETCDRVYVMYAGQIVEEADVFSLFENPKHPYTVALLMSTLTVKRRVSGFESITGQPPNLMQPPAGCRFHPRCSQVMARCRHESPPVVRVTETRLARCWLHVGN